MFLSRPLSGPLAQLVEQLTFNQWVTGSNPVRLTTKLNDINNLVPFWGKNNFISKVIECYKALLALKVIQ